MSTLPTPSELLPHRGIALVLDEITELIPGVSGRGKWTPAESYFDGHFPANPVLPGHWTTEAVNLLGGCVIASAYPEHLLLYREGEQKFVDIVRPGDTLDVSVEITSLRDHDGQLIVDAQGVAAVGSRLVFKASRIKVVGRSVLDRPA